MKRTEKKRRLRIPPAWGSVKRVWIVLLAVCNVLLLTILLGGKAFDAMQTIHARAQMDSLLAQRGVTCGSSVHQTLSECPSVYTLHMDSGMQQSFADAMLSGTVKVSAQKGNTTAWIGENGMVNWTSSGAVTGSFALNDQPQPRSAEEAEQLVCSLLKQAGISVREDQVTATQQETEYRIKIRQDIGTTELLGCYLLFTIAEGNETTLDGKWCTGETQALTVRALESYSSHQVLFQLIEAQPTITQIISAQPAYVLSDKSGGRFTSIPCWRFSTDAGEFVLNILSGDVVASSDIDAAASNAAEKTDTGSAFSE